MRRALPAGGVDFDADGLAQPPRYNRPPSAGARWGGGPFLGRPLDGGPYPYLWLDALTQKARGRPDRQRQCRGGDCGQR